MTRDEIKRIILNYIIQLFDVFYEDNIKVKLSISSYDGENLFILSDLGLDSLDEINLIMNIENEFSIILDSDVITHETTIGNLIDYIYNKLQNE